MMRFASIAQLTSSISLYRSPAAFVAAAVSVRRGSDTTHLFSSTMPTTTDEEYIMPEVWEPSDVGGKFGSMNKPTAAVRFDKELPVGKHPIQLYSLGTPNGQKVTILLEELLAAGYSGAEYDAWLIKIFDHEQFGSGFTHINPNQKIPALIDRTDPSKPVNMFESGSILLQLAEKFQVFLPTDPVTKADTINWLMWQMGSGPYIGQLGHFFSYAPEKIKYCIDRYTMETKRVLDCLNKQLDGKKYVIGNEYTIADMAIFPWLGNLILNRLYGDDMATYLNVAAEYPNVLRWARDIDARPAVVRGRKVNKTWGDLSDQLHERHDASDFETKTADKGKAADPSQ